MNVEVKDKLCIKCERPAYMMVSTENGKQPMCKQHAVRQLAKIIASDIPANDYLNKKIHDK
jgi:hypothetical protein